MDHAHGLPAGSTILGPTLPTGTLDLEASNMPRVTDPEYNEAGLKEQAVWLCCWHSQLHAKRYAFWKFKLGFFFVLVHRTTYWQQTVEAMALDEPQFQL